MKLSGQTEKWVIGILGVVSVLMAAHLVVQYKQMEGTVRYPVVKARPHPGGAQGGIGASVLKRPPNPRVPDDLAVYNSIVNVDLLKKYEDRPLPELKRDPFAFVAVAAPPRPQAPGVAAAPPPAPPPPPLNLKVMGYTEGKGAPDEAMVELCAASCENSSPDDQVLVVHAGDPVGTRYKVIKINPTVVTVEDAAVHQTVDLPIPQ